VVTSGVLVAKLWWDAPHDGLSDRLMMSDEVILFGRHSSCDIRIGHVPFSDEAVPRIWGELAWSRGQLDVTNRAETWGLELVPETSETSPPVAAMGVPAGGRGSLPTRQFEIRATVPHTVYVIRVSVAPRARASTPIVSDEPASVYEFKVSDTRKVIGRALISPLAQGRPRSSYTRIASETHYSEQAVKENIYWLDALFITAGLCTFPTEGDAPTRVARVLERHPGILR
jgi:hypothetical protein